MYYFDIDSKSWHKISQNGNVPSPRCRHTLIKINENQIFLFGGFESEDHDTTPARDSFIFNIDDNEWVLHSQIYSLSRAGCIATQINENNVILYLNFKIRKM